MRYRLPHLEGFPASAGLGSHLRAPRLGISRFSVVSASFQTRVSSLSNGHQASVRASCTGPRAKGEVLSVWLCSLSPSAQSVMLRRNPDSKGYRMRLSLRFKAGMRSSIMPFTPRTERGNKLLLALAATAGVAAALIMAAPGLSAAATSATGFRPAVQWSSHMCLAGEFCAMGDVNGDGRADAIAFTQGGNPGGGPPGTVFVALSTGHSFGPAVQWSSHMCLAGEFCAMG